jgi:hypothetical protein
MPEVIKLRTPIMFEGETVSELALDLDSLSGEDMIQAERAVGVVQTGSINLVNEMSKEYQAVIAAKASGKPVELIRQLKAKDFSEVTLTVQDFLLDMDSEQG